MSLNFGQITSLTTLAALEHLKMIVSSGFLCNFYSNLLILADNENWRNILSVWIYCWLLFQVKIDLPLSSVNYGASKRYAGSQVSDCFPFGYLFCLPGVSWLLCGSSWRLQFVTVVFPEHTHYFRNIVYLKILWKMEHLLFFQKYSNVNLNFLESFQCCLKIENDVII